MLEQGGLHPPCSSILHLSEPGSLSLYHFHHNQFQADLPFWLSLATVTSGPVLELGCGSGRVARPLAAAGVSMVGLDRSALALSLLSSLASQEIKSRLQLVRADFQHFRLAARFGLILMPCNTFSTLPPEGRARVTRCVHRHLKPEGRFVASLPNPELLAILPAEGDSTVEEHFRHPRTGDPVQVSSAWRRTDTMVTISWHYDCLKTDGTVERQTARAHHHLASLQDYTFELESAGLRLRRTFGDFDRSPYLPDSPHLILLSGLE